MKTIVFDFGNVIGFFDYRRSAERLARHTELDADAIVAAVRGDPLHDDYESGRITTDTFLRRVRELCRLRCSDAELIDAYVDIFQANETVCALLPRLRGRYRLLLGSNTCELHARQFQRQFADVLSHFDDRILSHEIGVRKPRPEFYAQCLRRAGSCAADSLFIDDLPANVAAAVAAGWHGIVYRVGDDLRTRLAALEVMV